MSTLSPADRSRLCRILGMLGSDHDGERASAGLLATRLLKERGIQWQDILGEDAVSRRVSSPDAGSHQWHGDLALAVRHIAVCRTWEKGFVESLTHQRSVSRKQRIVLAEIAAALRTRGLV